jgi:hypothetical protein
MSELSPKEILVGLLLLSLILALTVGVGWFLF